MDAAVRIPDVNVKASPLVFVRYGVMAPEYHWDDYAGIDVKGKTVVILVNDPGNEDVHSDPAFFKGKAMTYYGRWTYKYEEAARHGAAAAIIVHETGPAAYGWQVVRNSNSGNKPWLDTPTKDLEMVPKQGWITLETARDLFKRAGLDYAALKVAANKHGFKAVGMNGETLDVRRAFEFRPSRHAQHCRSRSWPRSPRRLHSLHRALGPSRHQAGCRRSGQNL